MSRKLRHALKGLATGLAVALALLVLRGTYAFESLELKTVDLRFRLLHDPARADTGVVIVDQDEASVDLLRADLGRPPWPRSVWAVLVDYLAAAGARVMAFDYTFPDPVRGDSAGDVAFAEAAARAGNVVHALTFQSILDSAAAERARQREDPAAIAALPRFARLAPWLPAPDYQTGDHPYPLLMHASYALGVINFTPDSVDGTVRRIPPLFRFRGHSYPALGLAAALAADPALSLSDIPLDRGAMLLRWKGPYRDPSRGERSETFRVIPVAQILYQIQTGDTAEAPPSLFRGKVVFFGSSASGTFEARANPFGPSDPGVLIHATMADNLLQRDFLRRASPLANAVLVLLAALLAGLAVAAVTTAWASAAAGAGLAAVFVGFTFWMFGARGLWLDAAAPALAVLFTFTAGMVVNYVTEGRQKRQIHNMFSKYVAPEYVAQLAEDPKRLHLDGHRAELSILFSDIRGFTTISESMSPTEVIGFLNVYLSRMAGIVKTAGGTLDKFIGDAVMAFWGEPVRLADHADRACDCALAMKEATEKLAAQFAAEGKPPIRIGIGINTADVVVGNIGSLEHKLDYTVIGDGVNLASRLEGLNKEHGTTIIISEFTHARLNGRYAVRALGDVKVKGKTKPVGIFELLGRVAPLLLLAAVPAQAQKSQWTDMIYVPGRWQGGGGVGGARLAPLVTRNVATDTLALVMRVDYFANPPRWRAEIRRSGDGQSFGEPDVVLGGGSGATVSVVTRLGATPLERHALGRDSLVRAAAAVLGAGGRREGVANGRFADRRADGTVFRVGFRRTARTAAFDDRLLDPRNTSAGAQLISSRLTSVGDQRSAGVVATAGARGVDRVRTPGGEVPVTPDTMAVLRMERFAVGAMRLEDFMRLGGLGPYKPDSAAAPADSAVRVDSAARVAPVVPDSPRKKP